MTKTPSVLFTRGLHNFKDSLTWRMAQLAPIFVIMLAVIKDCESAFDTFILILNTLNDFTS